MRRYPVSSSEPAANQGTRNDWATLKILFPYLWAYKWRVLLALCFLIGAKLANIGVPLVLKALIDHMTIGPNNPQALLVLPLGILVGYGVLRLCTTMFTELREFVFAKVTQRAVRTIALQVFRHLHSLSLRFHLNRQTGGMSRDIERGTRSISSLVSYTLFSILPTLIEIALVIGYLVLHYDIWFSVITFVALVTYIGFTVMVTEWRTHFRRTMNDLDSKANTKAIDSLINYETVKYFSNEDYEARRYDEGLQHYEAAAVKSQTSLSLLNTGQSMIIAIAVTLILWRATQGVIDGKMTLGDLVLVNAFMIQLYIPLNFLGVIYREIKQSLADMERLSGCWISIVKSPMRRTHSRSSRAARRSGFRMSNSVTSPIARFCSTSISQSPPAPQPQSWVIAAPENRRCRACCFVFTTSIRVQSRSTVKICAT